MKKKIYKYIDIDTRRVSCGSVYNLDIRMQSSNRSIIKGVIYDSNNEISISTIVEIKENNPTTKKSTILGSCLTNNKGEYIFVVEAKAEMLYEICVYSLIK